MPRGEVLNQYGSGAASWLTPASVSWITLGCRRRASWPSGAGPALLATARRMRVLELWQPLDQVS